MNRIRLPLILASALGLTQCIYGAEPAWLTPLSPYSFEDDAAGTAYSLPGTDDELAEWSIFNAASEAAEAREAYTIVSEDPDATAGSVPSYLALTPSGAIAKDVTAFLTLGVRDETQTTVDGAPTSTYAPLKMAPTGKMRVDTVSVKVRFVPTSEKPDTEALKAMYPTYEASTLAGSEAVKPVAIKLGVFVDESGYFCISRARFRSKDGTGNTGTSTDYEYEFVRTNYTNAEDSLGDGAVTIRIEFHTYAADYENYTRMFRIYAQKSPAGPNDKEVCLTEGLGCPWKILPIEGTDQYTYEYDFTEIGTGDFLPAWDTAVFLQSSEGVSQEAFDTINTLHRIGFSATDGGFYSAEIKTNTDVSSTLALQAYTEKNISLAGFEPYVTNPNSVAFSIYTDWATRYNVNLESYLPHLPGATTMSVMSLTETKDIDYVYNAFLLDMDPELDVTQSLSITGLSPDAETVTMTVRGPTGAQLDNLKAAKLCILRAATPDGLNASDVHTIYPSFAVDTNGDIIFALPTTVDEQALPFMKVVLVPTHPME